MNIEDLRRRLELTPEEMDNLIVTVKEGMAMGDVLDQYRVKVRDAQLDKVFNNPDLAIKGERGFIYLVDLLKEVDNG